VVSTEADIIRYLGVGVAVIGTAIAAPAGVGLITRSIGRRSRAMARRARGALARFIPALRRDVTVHAVTASARASLAGSASVSVTGFGWQPDADLDSKVERLREMIEAVMGDVGRAREEARQADGALADRISSVEQDLAQRLEELRNRIERAERDAARTDARGVLLLGLGVVLTGIPTELADVAVVGWAVVAGAILATASVIRSVLSGAG